ncbi:unnamed protein product [Larinioides sclopetarius]|uniref:DUF19 domain-containing protein n=1 Tax=Larinioides sclopetarius TaxID=280406 RepID=A0AAV2BMV1_9ARAC
MKMLLYICLVLGVWRGVTGKHVVCSKPTHQVCNTIGDATFPKTEADFDQICNELIKHLDCLEDYSNKCVFNGDLQLLSGMRDVVEDACRNDSSLHLRIFQNLGCFHEVIRYDTEACNNYRRDKSSTALKYILNYKPELRHEKDNYKLWTPFLCIMQSLEMV